MWIQIDSQSIINSDQIEVFFIRKKTRALLSEPPDQCELVAQTPYGGAEECYSEYILFCGMRPRAEEKLGNLVTALASACPVYQMRGE